MKNLFLLRSRILFLGLLLSNIYAITLFSPINVSGQDNPTVSIQQECLKGSEYRVELFVEGFVFPAGISGIIEVNSIDIGPFQQNGLILGLEGVGIPFLAAVQDPTPSDLSLFAFLDSNSNNQYDDGEPSASDTFVPLNCNVDIACPPSNLQHWTKIIFRITDRNIATSLGLPLNSELDITIMDKPSGSSNNEVSDLKYIVSNYLERPNMPRNAIQIVSADYSITCAHYLPEREFMR